MNVLIAEPHNEVRSLLVHIVERGGHRPLLTAPADSAEIDAVIVEPGAPGTYELALRLRTARPELPIICVSVYGREPRVDALRPSAFLLKPFAIGDLENAITAARTAPCAVGCA